MEIKKVLLFIFTSVMLLPLVKAQYYDYFYYSFETMFESYAFKFTLFALFFWLVCYYSFKNIFGGKAIPAFLAVTISLLITKPVLDNFGEAILGQEVIKWVLVGGAIIALFFLIKWIWGIFHGKGEKIKISWVFWILFAIAVLILTDPWHHLLSEIIKSIPPRIINTITTIAKIFFALGIGYAIYKAFFSRKAREERQLAREINLRQRGKEVEIKREEQFIENQQREQAETERKKRELEKQAEKLEREGRHAEAQKIYVAIGELAKALQARQKLVEERAKRIAQIRKEREEREKQERKKDVVDAEIVSERKLLKGRE